MSLTAKKEKDDTSYQQGHTTDEHAASQCNTDKKATVGFYKASKRI